VTPHLQTDLETPQTTYVDSYAFGRIIELAAGGGIPNITRRSMTTLLNILEPDPSLQRLFLVLDNLKKIYDFVHDICQEHWKPIARQILVTRKTTEALLAERNFFTEHIPGLDRKSHTTGYYSRKGSFRGAVGDYPLWCTLGDEPVQESAFSQYVQLLTQILVSLTAMENHPAKHLVAAAKYRALRAIRVLADERTSREFLSLPTAPLTPGAFLVEIEKLPADFRIHDVEGLFGDALDYIGPTEEPIHPGGNNIDKKPVPIDLPIEIAPPNLVEGEDPIDFAPRGYGILTSNSKTPKHLEYETGQQISKSLAKSNQLFPFSWSSLSSYDLDILLNLLAVRENASSDLSQLRAKAILQLMFWAGLTEEHLAALHLFAPQSDQPEFLDIQNGILRLKSNHPQQKRRSNSTPGKNT